MNFADECIEGAARAVQREKDRLIGAALTRYLGRPWLPLDIKGRAVLQIDARRNEETLKMDGVPLLRIMTPEIEPTHSEYGFGYRTAFNYEFLYPKEPGSCTRK